MLIVRKKLYNFPADRYSYELTNEMFKRKSWAPLGKFKRSQNPYVNYNSSYYLMLFGFIIRSYIDHFSNKVDNKRLDKSYTFI